MGLVFSKDNTMEPVKDIVVFEVLGGHVQDAEWRLGDWWTVGVLGLSRPYVKVKCGSQKERSEPKPCFFAQRGINVNFDKRVVFSMDGIPDSEGVNITVRDQRTVQATLRGDPLIGKAVVRIDRDSGSALKQERVELRRDDSQDPTGWLTVQYRLIQREVMRQTMLALGARPLRDIANAMFGVLQAPESVKRLLDSRPRQVAPATNTLLGGSAQEDNLRKRLEPLAASFCEEAESFSEEDDDQVLQRLAPLSREILKLIADFAQPETGEEPDTVQLASEWLKDLFSGVAGVNQSVEGGDTAIITSERLYRWFTSSHIDPDCLEPVDPSFQKAETRSQWTAGNQPPPGSVLGSGAYGSVFRARDRETKQVCAVKQMIFQAGRAKEAVTKRDCEVAKVLCLSAHPCVVRLFTVHEPTDCCAMLIMEYCAGGDLQNAIQSCRSPGGNYKLPPRAKQWLAQIFLGLEFLHLSVGMLVRDVKPQNVVLAKGGFCAKLTDFGMSRLDTVSDGAFSFHPSVPPGSPLYVAPEVIRGDGYDYHADLYSWAVLAWVLYTGGLVSQLSAVPPCAPFDGRRGAMELLKLLDNWRMLKACIVMPSENEARPLPSDDLKDLILRLTDRSDDYQQLSHEDVRSHALLQDMALPPHNNTAETMRWLHSLRDD